MIKAVLFDFDYTLVDSSRAVIECVNHALRELDHEKVAGDTIRRTIGKSLPVTYRTLTGDESAERAGEFLRLFVARADAVMSDMTLLIPSALDIVRDMRTAGYRTGIVSTKYRYRIEEILARKSIHSSVDVIIGGEDVAHTKPHPEGIVAAMTKLSATPAHTIYVGDSVVDAGAARSAGVRFVAVLSGVTREEEFAEYRPHAIISDMTQLPAILNGSGL
jgi:phosphoglycolate phosphatase